MTNTSIKDLKERKVIWIETEWISDRAPRVGCDFENLDDTPLSQTLERKFFFWQFGFGL